MFTLTLMSAAAVGRGAPPNRNDRQEPVSPGRAERAGEMGASAADLDALGTEIGELTEGLESFDWDQEFVHIHRSLENVWRRNGWAGEADQFALGVATGVSSIPPWQPMKRVSYIVDRFADRYEASDSLKLQVSMTLIRESTGLLLRHGRTMVSHAQEYLELRQAGQPFTAEHVARWAQEGAPVLSDLHEVADRVFEELRPQLSPQQQAILERDFDSYRRRRDVVEDAMKRWEKGEWKPEEWGLADDPIQTGTSEATPPAGQPIDFRTVNPPDAAPPPPATSPALVRIRCDEFAPETWAACAAEYDELFEFNPGQQTTADSIVAELSSRMIDYCKVHRDELAVVGLAERAAHPDFEPIRRSFAELRERIEAIPTTPQRQRAEERKANPASRAPSSGLRKTSVPDASRE